MKIKMKLYKLRLNYFKFWIIMIVWKNFNFIKIIIKFIALKKNSISYAKYTFFIFRIKLF